MSETDGSGEARELEGLSGLEVAVIGMACRFPGASNADEFWRNLRGGVESITYFSDEELAAAGEAPEMLANPNYVRVGRTIDGDTLFDATLFGLSPREAELVDPQQRLFLECAWEALEHAGHDPASFPGLVGVYGGVKLSTYLWHIFLNQQLMASVGELNAQIANDRDYLATRVSYKLGLSGPSLTVQTACSTSLVAIHLACQALLGGECHMALAGGVSVRTQQAAGYLYQEGEILSPDGHVRAFDAGANGTIFGNGLGIVVLRRLEDALADGDRIYAVIRGSAVNNDSALRVGFTAPGADGQERVVRAAHAAAEVEPGSIGYVEAHGTGTQVGDPIELTALTRAFRAGTQKRGFCAIGSVKTNIGHLASAAGVAGVIKTCLALHHKEIPPSLLCSTPNPQTDWAAGPFYVAQRLTPWAASGAPRRAGVSAFGIGGTNAHAVLEEAPPRRESGPSRPWQLLVLSARTETALEDATANLVRRLRDEPAIDLADAAFTLQLGRRALDHRRMLVCRDAEDAAEALARLDPARVFSRAAESRQTSVAFLFPGQGAQHAGMLAGVYDGEALFREQLDHCAELLAPHLGLDVRDLLYPVDPPHPPDPDAARHEEAAPGLEQTAITQPALFAVEYALARQWMAWGVQPAAMLGHSVGEYVAACLAGVMSLPDALAVVAARGRLMQALPPGAMLSVALAPADVEPLLGSQLSLAAHNAPQRTVVSGPEEAVAALASRLAGRGVDCRRLHTSHAFHSRMMEPALAAFAAELSRIELQPPRLPYVSNATGTWVTATEATDPGYWARHLLGTVRFSAGVELLLAEPQRVLLEVGPGQTLAALARLHPGRLSGQVIVAAARPVRPARQAPPAHPEHPERPEISERGDHAHLIGALGQVWLAGAVVDWRGFYAGERRHRLALPAYPFERRRYWIDPPGIALARTGAARARELADWFYLPYWKPSVVPRVEASPAVPGAPGGSWLVFADDLGLGTELAERLAGRGERVSLVVAGQRFAAHPGRVFEIAPARPEDYDALLAALLAPEASAGAAAGAPEDGPPGLPAHIVHLWTVTEGDPPVFPHGMAVEDMGFYSLLFLAQALGRQRLPGTVDLTIVSNGLHEVRGGERLCPEKALVLGPCKVMPQEYAFLSCRSVDVVPPAAGPADAPAIGGTPCKSAAAPAIGGTPCKSAAAPAIGGTPCRSERARLVELLLAEMAAGPREQVIAYRQGQRWLQAFEPARLGGVLPDRLPLRERGVYLITGGLGGIGLALAEHLARTLGARLVLTSRGGLPPRERWSAEAALRPAGDSLGDRIRQVQELERLGGDVLAPAADVTDERQMAALVELARRTFGALHGVIHAAGLPGAGIVQTKTRAVAASVLAPKVRGARALAAALAGTPLDFLVLCSSTIAVLGNLGQVDYCAANCFLDAFARDHSARHGVPAISINWGAWSEVGMAVNTAAPESALELRAPADLPGVPPMAGAPADLPGVPPMAGAPATAAGSSLHPLFDRLELAEPGRAVFSTLFSPARHWVLAEHHVVGTPTLPGTTYLEMARAAYQHLTGEPAAELREVYFLVPMMVAEGESREARTVLDRQGAGYRFRVLSRAAAGTAAGGGQEVGWEEHAFGEVGPAGGAAGGRQDVELEAIRRRCSAVFDVGQHLLDGTEGIVYWGPHWQVIKRVHLGDAEALVAIELPAELGADLDRYGLHPALLDAATSALTLRPHAGGAGQPAAPAAEPFLPLSYRRLRFAKPLPARFYCHLRSGDGAGSEQETLVADLDLLDETGAVLVEVAGFVEKRVGAAAARLQQAAGRPAGAPHEPAATAAGGESARYVQPAGQAAGRRGLYAADGMRNAEGVEVFLRILCDRPGPQVVTARRDLHVLLEQMAERRAHDPAGDLVRQAPRRAAHPRPNVATAFLAPRDDFELRLAQVWQDVLGIDGVGVHDNFYELGGDSVLGVQILARARQSGVELTSSQLFELQTIAALAAALGGTAGASAALPGGGLGQPPLPPAGAAPQVPRQPAAFALPAELAERLRAPDVEDVYPLSPLQQGLLFHSLATAESALYQEQLGFTFPGGIDAEAFEQAWRLSIDHHPALRTAFLWEEVEQPLQVVYRRAAMAVESTDLRDLPAAARAERLESLRRAERELPFALGAAPLMRLRLVHLAGDVCEGLWTHHHLLLDGWSSPLLLREVFASYRVLRSGGDPRLAPTRPFRDYIDWLQQRDAAGDEEFWRRALAGFTRPNEIGADRPASGAPAASSDFATLEGDVAEATTEALQSLARQSHATLNNFTQGMWALLLGHTGGDSDVAFGISVSTRPAALPGIESVIGLFINTLPFRARLASEEPVLTWLQGLQQMQQEMLDHVQVPLVEVKRWSEVPPELPLFESVFDFWNFPLDEEVRKSFTVGAGRYEVATHYPLSLRVIPGVTLHLQVTYDRRRFDDATAARLLRGLDSALAALAEDPATTVGGVRARLDESERQARRQRAGELAGLAQEKLHQGLRARRRPSTAAKKTRAADPA
jgi:acyl transferase domain-containing protein